MPENTTNFDGDEVEHTPEFDGIFSTFDDLFHVSNNVSKISTDFRDYEAGLDELLGSMDEEYKEQFRQAFKDVLRRIEKDKRKEESANRALETLKHSERAELIRPILLNIHQYEIATETSVASQSPRLSEILGWDGIASIFDKMATPDFVGFQPMAGPIGLAHVLRYQYKKQTEESAKDSWGAAVDFLEEAGIEFNQRPEFPEDYTASKEKVISLEATSYAIEAASARLSAHLTIETAQELKTIYGIDLKEEMGDIFSTEIAMELDDEILRDIRGLARYTDSSKSEESIPTVTIDDPRDPKNGIRIAIEIQRVANEIARKTRRGAGNFAVVSPMHLAYLQGAKDVEFKLADYKTIEIGRILFAGYLNKTIKVYVDSYADDEILVGYKGDNAKTKSILGRQADTGYVYCPYAILSSSVVVDPNSFQPIMPMLVRRGKLIFHNDEERIGSSYDYYQLIRVNVLTEEEETE